MNSRLHAINPNSILFPESTYTSFSRIGNEAEYNVPHIEEYKISLKILKSPKTQDIGILDLHVYPIFSKSLETIILRNYM